MENRILHRIFCSNECCIDSLLQLLDSVRLVEAGLLQNGVRRREVCKRCRWHLVHHQEVSLRPRVRDSAGRTVLHRARGQDDHLSEVYLFFSHVRIFVRPVSVAPELGSASYVRE